jgi:hypothetical protein
MNNSVITDILVFRTNIDSERTVEAISGLLNRDLYIRKWNVDWQDSDHILRVESETHDPEYIIQLITNAGFACEELPD